MDEKEIYCKSPKKLEAKISVELTEEGKRSLLEAFGIKESFHTYQNPNGSYSHEGRFIYDTDEFIDEIEPPA